MGQMQEVVRVVRRCSLDDYMERCQDDVDDDVVAAVDMTEACLWRLLTFRRVVRQKYVCMQMVEWLV